MIQPSSLDRGGHGAIGRTSAASSPPSAAALLALLLLRAGGGGGGATAFVVPKQCQRFVVVRDHHHFAPIPPPALPRRWRAPSSMAMMADRPPPESGDDVSGEGADLAAQFFRTLSDRNISLDEDEIDDDEDGDDDDYEEMERRRGLLRQQRSSGGDNIVGGSDEEFDDDDDAILREYDVSPVGWEGGFELTNEQIYDEMKDRVLESAGAFVELTKGADDGVSGGAEDDDGRGGGGVYRPPVNVPDSGLTAGEVVELVLAALRNNDVPSTDYGVEVLFGYSSPESLIVEQIESEGLSPSQYRNFLYSSEENAALFVHTSVVIDKADFSPDGTKGYFTARLITGPGESSIENDVSVNFILSTTGTNDDDCWMIDSMLIRPSKLRRRRRR